jgi:hypothetical protein
MLLAIREARSLLPAPALKLHSTFLELDTSVADFITPSFETTLVVISQVGSLTLSREEQGRLGRRKLEAASG